MSEPQQTNPSSAELFGSDRMWGLKELALPDPVSWWPQTTGWLVVSVILLAVVAWKVWRLWQRYQYNAYRRDGLLKLEKISQDLTKIIELPLLLKMSALKAAPRMDVASLGGGTWIKWLNKSAGTNLFEEKDAELLDVLAFAQFVPSTIDNQTKLQLVDASKAWMRSHHASN